MLADALFENGNTNSRSMCAPKWSAVKAKDPKPASLTEAMVSGLSRLSMIVGL